MLKETLKRLKSKTPKYFNKLRNACIAMTVVSGAAVMAKDYLPLYVTKQIPTLTTIGLVGTFFSSLPEEKKEDQTN